MYKASANPGSDVKDQVYDVNAWRQIFLVNEFNELQNYRLISCEMTLIAYAILMEGFNFKYYTSYDPDLNLQPQQSPKNDLLFLCVTTLIIYSLGYIQYAGRYILNGISTLNHIEFVDMCSILNISMIMFDESYKGYYIHGKSPYGQAEISTTQLKIALEFEASGKAQIRGLYEEEEEMQTFEIVLPD